MNSTKDILTVCLNKPANKTFHLKNNDYIELAEHLDTDSYNILDIETFLEELRQDRTNNIVGFLYTLVLGLDIEEKNYKLFAYILNSFDARLGYFYLIYRLDSSFRLRLKHLLLKNTHMFLDRNFNYWYRESTHFSYRLENENLVVVKTIVDRFLFEHDVLEQFYHTDIPDDVTNIILDYCV